MIPDGLDELRNEMPYIVELIVRTSRWVHPEVFKALPVWYPETARFRPIWDATYNRVYQSKEGRDRSEANVKAGNGLIKALGTKKIPNWTVCHIWGVDDLTFQRRNEIVRDHRYYSCVGNMIWLPTPLKGFTDCVPEIKRMLRTCAFHLYGWVCEHPHAVAEAARIRSGELPEGYPKSWPTTKYKLFPKGIGPWNSEIASAIEKRKSEIAKILKHSDLPNFPRSEVQEALDFWKIDLSEQVVQNRSSVLGKAKGVPKRPGKFGSGAYIRELIKQGKDAKEILELNKLKFPLSLAGPHDVAWNKYKLRIGEYQ